MLDMYAAVLSLNHMHSSIFYEITGCSAYATTIRRLSVKGEMRGERADFKSSNLYHKYIFLMYWIRVNNINIALIFKPYFNNIFCCVGRISRNLFIGSRSACENFDNDALKSTGEERARPLSKVYFPWFFSVFHGCLGFWKTEVQKTFQWHAISLISS